ncbi:MAG: sulfate permease [Desulfobacterales bacterium]|nr:sulfate permease [Desulfobacterales bacterium]
MGTKYKFNRLEFAGSLGDLGTLLPLAIGMILINGLSPVGVFFTVGLFYILSGWYFRVTTPVQPMKVIGAYAVATAMEPGVIMASCALMGLLLLIIGGAGAMTVIGRYIPKAVVRGVQLSTGAVLMAGGVKLMMGESQFQILKNAAEPYLSIQSLGPIPIGVVIGVAGAILTLLLLENKKLPAGLLVVLCGVAIGLALGTREGLARIQMGISLPEILPFGFPAKIDFSLAIMVLVLPQIPMTLGNAVIAQGDLAGEYFGEKAERVTYKAACISMGLANLGCFLLGGMPLCHGAGGLAAHYRFGARTPGSNMIIGVIFIALALLLGVHSLAILYLMPMAILGVLLIFAGAQLALTIIDLRERRDFFVTLLMLGITLATNLAVSFLAGLLLAHALKWGKLKV